MALFKKDDKGNFWRLEEDCGVRTGWLNSRSHFHAYEPGDLQKFEIYEAEDFEDFSMAGFLYPSLANGWIDRAGHFWGCDSHSHHRIIYDVMRTTAAEAERAGWIKIEPYNWICSIRPSPEQTLTLTRIGRDSENPRFRDDSLTFEEAFPHGYRLKALPRNNAVRVYPDGAPAVPKPPVPRF